MNVGSIEKSLNASVDSGSLGKHNIEVWLLNSCGGRREKWKSSTKLKYRLKRLQYMNSLSTDNMSSTVDTSSSTLTAINVYPDSVCWQACTLARRNADVFLKYLHRNSVNMPGMLSHIKAPETQVKSKYELLWKSSWTIISEYYFINSFS